MSDKKSVQQMRSTPRQEVLLLYIAALEDGDFDTVDTISQVAEQDEALERMIADVHRSYRTEEDASIYVKEAAFVQQLLQKYKQDEQHIKAQAVSNSRSESIAKAYKAHPIFAVNESSKDTYRQSTKSTLFKQLKGIGLDREFVLSRLLPEQLAIKLQGNQETKETHLVVQQAATLIEKVFCLEPGAIFQSTQLSLSNSAIGATRFKKSATGNTDSLNAYTLYARYLAELVLKTTENLPRKPIPTDAHLVQQEVIKTYSTCTFEHVLLYVWSLGIPVLPLSDKGVFHGACWRIDSRNVIVIKQRTLSNSRWLFDLLHELRHAGQSPEKAQFEVIESDNEHQMHQLTEEERVASQFAGDVILDGRAEELTQMCVKAAGGIVERLKTVVPKVAKRERVAPDALANYIAFRLSLQGLNWWGAANNLQTSTSTALQISRDMLIQEAQFETLDETDQQLLIQALFNSEV